jgi:hypothetical protein
MKQNKNSLEYKIKNINKAFKSLKKKWKIIYKYFFLIFNKLL